MRIQSSLQNIILLMVVFLWATHSCAPIRVKIRLGDMENCVTTTDISFAIKKLNGRGIFRKNDYTADASSIYGAHVGCMGLFLIRTTNLPGLAPSANDPADYLLKDTSDIYVLYPHKPKKNKKILDRYLEKNAAQLSDSVIRRISRLVLEF